MNADDIDRLAKPDSRESLEFLARIAIKAHYGLHERQLTRLLKLASKSHGNIAEALLMLCERRLDNVLVRVGFCRSRTESKQVVQHGHFCVNGQCVKVPAYLVKLGDSIAIVDRKNLRARYQSTSLAELSRVSWLSQDSETNSLVVTRLPTIHDVSMPVDVDKLKLLFTL